MLHSSHHHDADWVAPLVLGMLVAAAIAAYFVGRLLVTALTAGVRIYAEHGFTGGPMARVLWWALGGLAALLVLCGLAFLIIPATAIGDAALASWGFLVFAITVAVCGWKGEKRIKAPGVVDTYLPFGAKQAG